MGVLGTVVQAVGRVLAWLWNHSLGFLLRWLLIGMITGYRLLVSPMLPPTCRFHPSCSAYALQAVTVHGPLKGSALAGWRLLRCNPWNGGGLDPVPERGRWLPDVLPNGEPRSATMRPSSAAG